MGGEFVMNNFHQCLEYSLGAREKFDESLLIAHIPNCVSVKKTGLDLDRAGIDYIATLKDGATVTIDSKTRQPGVWKYWKYGEPELALEAYSIEEKRVVGWLFKRSAVHPDYILYTFDRRDTDKFYFIPFILLKRAAFGNWKAWERRYGLTKQPNKGYTSTAIFVPASLVLKAVTDCMTGTVQQFHTAPYQSAGGFSYA